MSSVCVCVWQGEVHLYVGCMCMWYVCGVCVMCVCVICVVCVCVCTCGVWGSEGCDVYGCVWECTCVVWEGEVHVYMCDVCVEYRERNALGHVPLLMWSL